MNIKRLVAGRPFAIRVSDFDAIRIAADNWNPSMQMVLDTDEGSLMHLERGCAVIEVNGVIVKEASLLDSVLGGVCSIADLNNAINEAIAANPRAVILNFASPGGTVSGVPEFSSRLYDTKGKSSMPFIAVCDGDVMASAAYWIASQCDQIVVSEGSEIGSVGVIATVYDFGRAIRNQGVDPYTFKSDDIKAAGSGLDMDSASAREIQAQVAKYTSMFRDAVKRGRNLDALDSKVYVGADAIAAGYADELGSLDSVISKYGSK